ACNMPAGVFAHVHGASFEVGRALVEHPFTKAVGFTGSYTGGKQLFDWANQRKEPIPVFAEMSSINPVFFIAGENESIGCRGGETICRIDHAGRGTILYQPRVTICH
ncbi:MAG: aldehyde dehydrogenase family protein, partial [Bacteroidia bacterium]|nr:aldehyde dehydrogenase family protein [Bacteroidia bacterium]